MFTKTKLALALVAATTLAGCDNGVRVEDETNFAVQQEANKDVMTRMNVERQELKSFVTKLQQQDPDIKDAYYTVDPQSGQRVLNIVREEDDGNAGPGVGSFFVYSMLGAMVGNNLSSSFSPSNGSYHKSLSSLSTSTTRRTKEEERQYRSTGYAGYVATHKKAAVAKIRSNPARMKTIRTGVMSRISSSRSASYSSGGSRGA